MMGTDFPGFGFGGNCSSNAFQKCKGLLQGGVVNDSVDTTLRLDPLASKAPHHQIFKGLKRKWFGMDRNKSQQAKRTLGLSLVHRSSSSPESRSSSGTACTEEESSQVLDLDFTLNLGTEKSPSPNKPLGFTSVNPLMNVDLELSLSTVCSEPDMSSLHIDSHVMQICDEGTDGYGGALFDDAPPAFVGKTGNIMQPFPVPETRDTNFFFKPVPRRIDSTSFGSDFLAGVVTAPISSVICTSGSVQTNLQEQPQRSNNSKMCKFTGCSKGARGASGLCIAHGGGRRCQKLGCHKGAEGRTAFCKAHGGGRRCEFLGCTKSSEGRTDFCIAHGGGRRCTHESCNKAARGKSGLCIRHGGGKRCQWENCTRSAEGLSGLCISHGGGRRCQYPLCTKGAQGSTMLCKGHGGGKRCQLKGAQKAPKGAPLSARVMVEEKGALFLAARKASMGGHLSVWHMGVGKDVLSLNALRVQGGGQISVSVMVGAGDASLRVVERVHKAAPTSARSTGEERDAIGHSLDLSTATWVMPCAGHMPGERMVFAPCTEPWFRTEGFTAASLWGHWSRIPSLANPHTTTACFLKGTPVRIMQLLDAMKQLLQQVQVLVT